MIGIVTCAEEKARILSGLIGLPASAEKDMCFLVLTAYVGSNNRYVDDWILKLVLPGRYSKYRQTDPRKSVTKTVRFRKSLNVQRRVVVWWGFERQGLVCFLEPCDFDDPGSEDLINEEWFRTSGTHQARGMSEDGAGIRTRPIMCQRTVRHYCFIDIDYYWDIQWQAATKTPINYSPSSRKQACKLITQHAAGWRWSGTSGLVAYRC